MKPPSEADAVDVPVENPVAGIDQSVGDFKYDVNYEFDAGTGLTELPGRSAEQEPKSSAETIPSSEPSWVSATSPSGSCWAAS